jgi:crotonobetaine/carnitine-CoA ligase
VQRLGFGLHLEGVRAGDTVVIMTGNTVEAVQSWLAVNMAEAVEVTINIAYRGPLLIHAIKTALAKTIIIEDRFVSELVAVADQLPQLTTVIVLGQIGRMKTGASSRFRSYERSRQPIGAAVRVIATWLR